MRDLLRMSAEIVTSSMNVEFNLSEISVFKLTFWWFLREFRVNDYFASEYSALISRTDYITNMISFV